MQETVELEIRTVVSEIIITREQDLQMEVLETTAILNLAAMAVLETKAVSRDQRTVSREVAVSEMKAVSRELKAVRQEVEDSEMKHVLRETRVVHQDRVEASEMEENLNHNAVKVRLEGEIPVVEKEAEGSEPD